MQLSFANERTFLAWERTALGLITAGLAITQLLPSFDFPGGRRLIGLPLIALGHPDRGGELLGVAPQPGRDRGTTGRSPARWLPLVVAIVVSVVALFGFVLVIVRGLGLTSDAPRRAAGAATLELGRRAHRPGLEPQRARHRRLRARRHARAHAQGFRALRRRRRRGDPRARHGQLRARRLARPPSAGAGSSVRAGAPVGPAAAGDRRDRDRASPRSCSACCSPHDEPCRGGRR